MMPYSRTGDPALDFIIHPPIKERDLRGLKPPVYCTHCSRKITGRVYWIGRNPYCSYCYGFRAVLIEREKRKKMDDKTREELKKRLLQEDEE